MSAAPYLASSHTIRPANIECAAVLCYVGSSFHAGPWADLPESRKTAWRKTAAHLLAPRLERHSAVRLVHERDRRARLKELAG